MPRDRIGAIWRLCDVGQASRGRCTTLWLAAIVAMLLVDAGSARAGTYVMHNCDVPGPPNSPMHPWEALENGQYGITITDNCASGAGVSLSLPDTQQLPDGAKRDHHHQEARRPTQPNPVRQSGAVVCSAAGGLWLAD